MFDTLQQALSKSITLVHYDFDKVFQIDFNTFKEFDFSTIAFQATQRILLEGKQSFSILIQLILSFFRHVTITENNYQPIKLEIVSFIQMIKKLRHLIEFFYTSIIIKTNYLAIFDIMQQSFIISTSSTIKINICLIRTSQFL